MPSGESQEIKWKQNMTVEENKAYQAQESKRVEGLEKFWKTERVLTRMSHGSEGIPGDLRDLAEGEIDAAKAREKFEKHVEALRSGFEASLAAIERSK